MAEPIYSELELLIISLVYGFAVIGIYIFGKTKLIETIIEKYLEELANGLDPNVEKVTRCKDCKYYNSKCSMCFLHWDTGEDEGFSFQVWPEDYCKFAKRRDNDG